MEDIELDPPNPEKENEGRIRVLRVIRGKGIVNAGEELLTNPDTSSESLDDNHDELPQTNSLDGQARPKAKTMASVAAKRTIHHEQIDLSGAAIRRVSGVAMESRLRENRSCPA